MIAALVLWAALGLPPGPRASNNAANGCAFPAMGTDERARADALTGELRAAEERSAKHPSEGVAALQAALDHASREAVLVAKSEATGQAQRYARLALVRSLLATGDRTGATALMDEMLAVAGDESLPAKLYGPGVLELHAERTSAVASKDRGELVVECDADCVAIAADTRLGCAGPARPLRVQLPVGTWHVTTAAMTDATRTERAELELVSTRSTTVRFGAPDRVDPPQERPKRLLPRWAGILGMSVGAAAMIAGGVLVGVDGKCPDLSTDPTGASACGRRLNTDVPGIVLLAGGGAVVTGFTIAFGIGEARQVKARRANASGRPTP